MQFRHSALVGIMLAALPLAGAAEIEDGLHQAIHQALYRLEPSGPGAYRAVNRAQHLSLDFSARGARLDHPEGNATLHLLGYGYGRHLRTPGQVQPVIANDRVEYRRADLTEWYKNDASGLEQGFTLSQRPGDPGAADPLVIALGVEVH